MEDPNAWLQFGSFGVLVGIIGWALRVLPKVADKFVGDRAEDRKLFREALITIKDDFIGILQNSCMKQLAEQRQDFLREFDQKMRSNHAMFLQLVESANVSDPEKTRLKALANSHYQAAAV